MPEYVTHVFDVDGVLLASNAGKAQAFYEAALPYGEDAATAMVEYHRTAGSVSREDRWKHFFSEIVGRDPEEGELEWVNRACTKGVLNAVRESPKVEGVERYLETLSNAVVVSGVATDEVRLILREHGLADYFTGIYGGPRRKAEVLKRLLNSGDITLPAVYYGDTEDDYNAATANGLDFVLVAGDAEWDWRGHPASANAISDFSKYPTATANPQRVKVRVDRNGYGGGVYVGRSLAGAEVWV